MNDDQEAGKDKRIILSDDADTEVSDFLDNLNRQLEKENLSADEKHINSILGNAQHRLPEKIVLPESSEYRRTNESTIEVPQDRDLTGTPTSDIVPTVQTRLENETIEEYKTRILKEARATFTALPKVQEEQVKPLAESEGLNKLTRYWPLVAAAYAALIIGALSLDFLRSSAHKKTLSAQALSESGEYQEALKEAYQATQLNMFSAEAYREKGEALGHLLRYADAETALNSALFLDPGDREALEARASLCVKTNKPDQTITDTNKLISLAKDPSELSARLYGNRAIAYFRKGNYKEALADYDRALKMEPINYSLQLGKAFCLAADRQYIAACRMCDYLLRLYPDNDQVLCERGFCLQAMGRPQEALRDFNMAIGRDNLTARWHVYRGGLYRCLGKTKEATEDYVQAAKLEPSELSIQETAADLLKQQGDFSRAAVFYDRLAGGPNFRSNFMQQKNRSAVLREMGRIKEALKDSDGALRIKYDQECQIRKALCLAQLGQWSEAERSLAEAAKGSDKVLLMKAKAQAAELSGNKLSAIDQWTEVLEKNPSDFQALSSRAKLYMERSQWHSAAADLTAALKLAHDTGLENKLAQCRRAMGDKAHITLTAAKPLNLSKVNKDRLVKEGYRLFNASEPSAGAYFMELAAREPDSIEWRRYLAYSLELADEHEAALECFNKMAQVGGLTLQDKLCQARAFSAEGNNARALDILQPLAENGDPRVKLELARVLSASGDNKHAVIVAQEALCRADGATRMKLQNLLESLQHSLERQKDREQKNNHEHDSEIPATPETQG